MLPKKTSLTQLQEFVAERLLAPTLLLPDLPQDNLDRAWLDFVADGLEIEGEASMCQGDESNLMLCLPAEEAFCWFDSEEWYETATHCASWYEEAAAKFLSQHLGACLVAPFLTAIERPKHFPRASDRSADDLQRRSKRDNESIFNFGVDSGPLAEFTRSVESDTEVFPLLFGADTARIFVHAGCNIGFTSGKATNVVAIEWASSAVHCYPFDLSAIPGRRAEDLIYDDLLQGYARDQRDLLES
jgi:hypothetical protein